MRTVQVAIAKGNDLFIDNFTTDLDDLEINEAMMRHYSELDGDGILEENTLVKLENYFDQPVELSVRDWCDNNDMIKVSIPIRKVIELLRLN